MSLILVHDSSEETLQMANQYQTCRLPECYTQPGPMRHSKTATTPLDSWKIFFSDKIIHEIVVPMNDKITAFQNNLSNKTLQNDKYIYIHTTDIAEVYAFIGLIYARGLLGQNVSAEKMFSDSYGHPIFTATMSKKRFRFDD